MNVKNESKINIVPANIAEPGKIYRAIASGKTVLCAKNTETKERLYIRMEYPYVGELIEIARTDSLIEMESELIIK